MGNELGFAYKPLKLKSSVVAARNEELDSKLAQPLQKTTQDVRRERRLRTSVTVRSRREKADA